MLRFNLALLAVALTAAAAGCTQCDTCDDFPMPCAGGSCAGGVCGRPGLAGPGSGLLLTRLLPAICASTSTSLRLTNS